MRHGSETCEAVPGGPGWTPNDGWGGVPGPVSKGHSTVDQIKGTGQPVHSCSPCHVFIDVLVHTNQLCATEAKIARPSSKNHLAGLFQLWPSSGEAAAASSHHQMLFRQKLDHAKFAAVNIGQSSRALHTVIPTSKLCVCVSGHHLSSAQADAVLNCSIAWQF